jgi:hypothetical protein
MASALSAGTVDDLCVVFVTLWLPLLIVLSSRFLTNSTYAAALCALRHCGPMAIILNWASGILYYDHALTFEAERKHFWSFYPSQANILFLLNRYFSFIANIALLAVRYFRTTTSVRIPLRPCR